MSCMKDYTGQKFNMLTAVRFSRRNKNQYFWLFKCDCGKEKEININNVNRKIEPVKSCGCASGRKYSGIQVMQYACYTESYADGDLTFEQFVELSQRPCLYCGKLAKDSNCRKTRVKPKSKKDLKVEEFHYNGLDRVDNTKPHMKDNVVPCCARCNSWKQNLTFKEFKTIIGRIHLKVRDLYL